MPSVFKSYATPNIGVAPIDIFVVPPLTSTTVIGLSLANVVTSQINVTATITKGVVVTNVIKNIPIPPGSSAILFGGEQKLVLEAGNKLSLTSSAATSLDVVASVLEIS